MSKEETNKTLTGEEFAELQKAAKEWGLTLKRRNDGNCYFENDLNDIVDARINAIKSNKRDAFQKFYIDNIASGNITALYSIPNSPDEVELSKKRKNLYDEHPLLSNNEYALFFSKAIKDQALREHNDFRKFYGLELANLVLLTERVSDKLNSLESGLSGVFIDPRLTGLYRNKQREISKAFVDCVTLLPLTVEDLNDRTQHEKNTLLRGALMIDDPKVKAQLQNAILDTIPGLGVVEEDAQAKELMQNARELYLKCLKPESLKNVYKNIHANIDTEVDSVAGLVNRVKKASKEVAATSNKLEKYNHPIYVALGEYARAVKSRNDVERGVANSVVNIIYNNTKFTSDELLTLNEVLSEKMIPNKQADDECWIPIKDLLEKAKPKKDMGLEDVYPMSERSSDSRASNFSGTVAEAIKASFGPGSNHHDTTPRTTLVENPLLASRQGNGVAKGQGGRED